MSQEPPLPPSEKDNADKTVDHADKTADHAAVVKRPREPVTSFLSMHESESTGAKLKLETSEPAGSPTNSSTGGETPKMSMIPPSSLLKRKTPPSFMLVRKTPPSFVKTPPTPSVSSPPSVAPNTQGRRERWIQMLLPAFMQDCEETESPLRRELCARIVKCLPSESQEAKDTFLMLLLNLKDEKNTELRCNIVSGKMPVEVLVTLGEQDLVNPERREQIQREFQERAKDTNLTEIEKAMQTSSTMFKCPSCKKRDCSFYEKQTRSADEPMTIFCTCNKCGRKWKI